MAQETTLFIYLRLGSSHRAILRSELFPTLRSNPNLRLVIISPLGDEAYLRGEFQSGNVFVERLPKTRADGLERKLKKLKNYIWLSHNPPQTFRIRRERTRRGRLSGRLRVLWEESVAAFMSVLGITEKSVGGWEIALFRRRRIARLFDRYRPDAVLFTKLHSTNIHVVKEAKKRNVETVCFVEGWDNPTSKGPFSVEPDHILVWNDCMKREIVEHHGFPAEKIDVVGVPQFDFYYDRSKFCGREEYFRKHGFDPARKLIAYCVAGGTIARTEPLIVDMLYRAMMEGQVKSPAQLLVRLHPTTHGDYLKQFDRFKGLPHLILQPAGRVAKIQDGWDPSRDDMTRLAETMIHSNVVVNVQSTISLDAIAFDTPVIGIAFEGDGPHDYLDSYRRYYDYTHFNPVLRNGGLRLAGSLAELIEHVNRYLDDPSLDAEGRARVRKEQMYALDGKSARRAGEAVLKAIGLRPGGAEAQRRADLGSAPAKLESPSEA
ncbi:MAG: hypothetical protein A3F90_13480 [Deltaproteobacteria bacterium RIFCSPLOWO2_12_FULL_60_19]|nr:MAG: hypothetical protein A3F90_13480 [Deltaproteobacteria bacterium RIFCSPLOWO2_12_FULL_60_19]